MSVALRHRALAIVVLAVAGILALTAATIGRVAAQDTTTVTTTEASPTVLTVSGHGTVKVEPDTASVSFGVTIDDETLSTAQAEATETMAAIIATVTGAGVEERDIQTVDFSVTIVYDYDDDGTVSGIIGYQVSNTVNVTVRDLDALGGILDAVVASGANNVYGVSFFVNDATAAASLARTAAVEDAMTKANEIAAATGLQVSRVASISEQTSVPPTPIDYYPAPSDDMAEGSASSVPVQAGSTEITSDIDVTFELVPVE